MSGYQNTACESDAVHEEAIEAVRKQMPDVQVFYDLSGLFKMFSDGTRLQILYALKCGELCVCDLAELLGATKSAVSHQLKSLRLANLVKFRKHGKSVFYSLSDSHVKDIFETGLEHINE